MPFVVSSAPEICHRIRKHVIIKGLEVVEVVVENFLIVGGHKEACFGLVWSQNSKNT